MKYCKTFLFGIIFVVITTIVSPVFAESFSLSLNPEKHELIAKPGNTITLPYSLSNVGDAQALTFKVYSLKPNDDGTSYELSPFEQTTKTPQFAIVNAAFELNKTFLMHGKSTVLFDVEVTIPENTPRKDFYVTLVAESDGLKGEDGMSSIQLEGGIGSHILLSVTDSGTIDQEAKISQFEIHSAPSIKIFGKNYSIVDKNKPIQFSLTLANQGNNYIYTNGKIGTSSSNGLNLPHSTILANSTRTISSFAKKEDQLFSKKLFGFDTVMAKIQVGNSKVLYSNANIIVVPVKMILILFVFLVVSLSAYFYFILRKRK
jgi:hypothetical protein